MSTQHDTQWVSDYWRLKREQCICTLTAEAGGYHRKPPAEMTRLAADVIAAWEEQGATLPPCFEPNFGTFTMALPWGGEIIEQQDSYPFLKPVSDDIDRILDIVPAENPHLARAVDTYRAVCERTGRTDIRFMSPDHQGILSTAAMIMDQPALFMAMLTDPDKVHRLLARVAEVNIAFLKRLIAEVGRLDGNFWPSMWLPHTVGITVIEDMMPLLSANLYQEFGLPYLKRYSDEFGGVFIHCCGDWRHQMRLLAEADMNLLGFEYLHPHVTLDDIQAHFEDIVVVPTLSAVGVQGSPDYRGFSAELLAKQKEGIRLWFASSTGRGIRPEELDELTASAGRRGCSPIGPRG